MLDLTMQAIQASLDGLAARQRITAREPRELRDAGLHRADGLVRGQPRVARSGRRPDRRPQIGSHRSLDRDRHQRQQRLRRHETIAMIDTGLRYQLATESMNNKFRILHDSMRQDL